MRKRFDHEPPPWIRPEATYFVTVCARDRAKNTFCQPEMGRTVLDSIQLRNEKKIWFCSLAVLMPDHVHLILDFPDNVRMPTALRDWKSYLAKNHGVEWQKNFFDHRLRSYEQFGQKAEYILMNPVRAGLIDKAEDWPYLWRVDV